MPNEKRLLQRIAKMLKREKKRRHRNHRSRTRSRSPRVFSVSDSSGGTRTPSPLPSSDQDENTPGEETPADLMELEDVGNSNVQVTPDHLAPFREALGEEYEDSIKFEGQIQNDIGKRWDHILVTGLNKDEKEAIIKKYKLPENCKLLDAPILNEEVRSVLTENSKIRDKSIENNQYQLGVATAILGRVMTDLMGTGNIDKVAIIRKLSDSAKLLNDLHFHKTKTRKLLISPLLDKSFINFVEKVKRDEHLYGMDLANKIKTSQEIKKSSSSIKKTVPRTAQNKNIPKARTAGNRQGPPPNHPRTRLPAARGGPKMPQPPFQRSRQNQSRPERAAPRHAYNRQ